ncbi:hypothetical protein EIN_090220 [Entamoeba invadens IP1]|uniref:RRM domain-containing protein n=1 Tax=Entamoeba invadens IP1 TaxID=370355 RepID=A0A0A1TVH6_ENTIV|nr:hypothetical protein EIN_090220 [Entamoeba invadens IP1]ELP84389.1 hypothetical protein EIN_090220 [Entamoeba invadens IP1]|eukprot:XP_004183735.1 hypothetical protein EIN_090220 [Entamoeba invadens IP1]
MTMTTIDTFQTNCTLILSSLPSDVCYNDIINTFQKDVNSIKSIELKGSTISIVFHDHFTPLRIYQTRTSYRVKNEPIQIYWKLSKKEIASIEYTYAFFGLKPESTDMSVQVCLGEYVQIKSFHLICNKCGVYSIIKFSTSEDVENVFKNYSEIKEKIGTEKFSIKHYKKETETEKCLEVIIKNIHHDLIANSEFFEYFNSFGNIKNFNLSEINPKFNDKMLYVEYFEENDAKTFIKEVDGNDVFNCDMPLSASFVRKNDTITMVNNTDYKRKGVENSSKNNNLFLY